VAALEDGAVAWTAHSQSSRAGAYASANGTPAGRSICNFFSMEVTATLNFHTLSLPDALPIYLLNCNVAGFKSFTLNLSAPTNATITRASVRVGIVGDGNVTATPGLYVRDGVVDNGAGSVQIPVLLGGPSGSASNSTVTVGYAT